MAMKENSVKVLNYLKGINGADVTAADVAEALDLPKKSVDGIFTCHSPLDFHEKLTWLL